MIKVSIGDRLTGRTTRIGNEGEQAVVIHPHPPKDEDVSAIPVREFFKTSAGSSDMKVDGSTTNVRFTIESDVTQDKYIKTISVVIADASATLSKFGNLTALSNGVVFGWESTDLGDVTIADALKSNFDFVRLALGNPPFGDAAGAFRASNIISTSEGYVPVIDFAAMFGLPWGLRLKAGSADKIVFTVRDNVTGVDQFDAIAYGIKI
jgi:hypothetical protein